MEWLNYHHLLYFWTVAHEGSVRRASETLGLAPPTVSGQIKELERSLGATLLERRGRRLALTDTGQIVYRYADEIFALGRELQRTLKGTADGAVKLAVGTANSVPEAVVHRLIEPLLANGDSIHVVCEEGRLEHLLHELTAFRLDVVIADVPMGPSAPIRGYSHLLGTSPVGLFGTAPLARRLRPGFPRSLEGAPLLLPAAGSQLRHLVEQWLDGQGVCPHVVGEFEDPDLMMAFGASGRGLFPGPTAIATAIRRQHEVQIVRECEGFSEEFYAITVERRIHHPFIAKLASLASVDLFAEAS